MPGTSDLDNKFPNTSLIRSLNPTRGYLRHGEVDLLANAVSTGSGSDRVAMIARIEIAGTVDPVASTTPRGLPARGPRSAPGTDPSR